MIVVDQGLLPQFEHGRLATERVSVANGGAQANGHSDSPAISADGRFVAFASEATNLIGVLGETDDTNNVPDVFVRDRATGTTERVSLTNLGTQANGRSDSPAISTDGRFVAFTSKATNLTSSTWVSADLTVSTAILAASSGG